MEAPSEFSQPMPVVAESRALQVDFSWRKFKSAITDSNNPEAEPIYILDWQAIRKPHLIFLSTADNSTIGTGTFHTFKIDADYEVHGQKGTLQAQKRFKTKYTHHSYAFSDNDSPVTMTWTSDLGLKTWDFVCVDEQQMPVAKFSANMLSLKKVGKFEFMGPKAHSDAVRDEIVVTGLTLVYCMLLRSNSIFSFFGAIFSRPGHDKSSETSSWKSLEEGAKKNPENAN